MPIPSYTPTLAATVPSVDKRTQIAVENTPGLVAHAATWKRLPNLTITPGPKFKTTKYRGQGYKLPSQILEGSEYATFKYDGPASYAELCYILASYLSTPTVATIGTTAKSWPFVAQTTNIDGGPTFSIQHGNAVNWWLLTYGRFASLTMNITKDAIKVSGDGIGQRFYTSGAAPKDDGGSTTVTWQTSPTAVENVPFLGNQINASLDTSYAALGNTQLKSAFEIEIAFPNKFNPTFPLNTGNLGHGGDVEIATEPTVKLKLAANADSDALVGDIHAATELFMQVAAVSPAIADATAPTYYSMLLNMAMQVAEGGDLSDSAGVYVADWTAGLVVDSVDNFVWSATVVNKTAGL